MAVAKLWNDITLTWDKALIGAQGSQGEKGNTGYDSAPIGSVIAWSRKTIPWEYVLANGQRLTKADYPQGYDCAVEEVALGNPEWTYRTSDETFTVPDVSDRFIFAAGAKALGDRGGAEEHILTTEEMAPHNHSVSHTFKGSSVTVGPSAYAALRWDGNDVNFGGLNTTIGNSGGGQAHNNMPPYVVLAQLVKVRGVTANATEIQGPPGAQGVPGPKGDPSEWRPVVCASTNSNDITQDPPAIIDAAYGALIQGERVLLAPASGASWSGIWVFQGTGIPMVRPDDANDGGDFFGGKLVYIQYGSFSGQTYRFAGGDGVFVGGGVGSPLPFVQHRVAPMGAAGGALSGTYPNPQLGPAAFGGAAIPPFVGPIAYQTDPGPSDGVAFNIANPGRYLMMVSGNGFNGIQAGYYQFRAYVDAVLIASVRPWNNQVGIHTTFPTLFSSVVLTAGTHRLHLATWEHGSSSVDSWFSAGFVKIAQS